MALPNLMTILASAEGNSLLLPPAASTFTPHIDWVFYFVTWVAIFFFPLIIGVMVYFAVVYRKEVHPNPEATPTHHLGLELLWSVVPLVIVMYMFWIGVQGMNQMYNEPGDNAYEVMVSASKWNWSFKHPNGHSESFLEAPVGRPVKLIMRSSDVIHSLFVPAFRIKRDIVPGRYTTVWFEATKTGTFPLYCAEYCGTNHSRMITEVRVKPANWLPPAPVVSGDKLYETFCKSCHTNDGKPLIGPSFQGLFGATREMASGAGVLADEAYIRESIREPQAKIAKGGLPGAVMTKFSLTDEEVELLVDYIKRAKDGPPAPLPGAAPKPAPMPMPPVVNPNEPKLSELAAKGKELYTTKICITCHQVSLNDPPRAIQAPSHIGIYGRVTELQDGTMVTVDDAYIIESIKTPLAKVAKGYQPIMPPMPMTDDEIKAIIEYLKTLK